MTPVVAPRLGSTRSLRLSARAWRRAARAPPLPGRKGANEKPPPATPPPPYGASTNGTSARKARRRRQTSGIESISYLFMRYMGGVMLRGGCSFLLSLRFSAKKLAGPFGCLLS